MIRSPEQRELVLSLDDLGRQLSDLAQLAALCESPEAAGELEDVLEGLLRRLSDALALARELRWREKGPASPEIERARQMIRENGFDPASGVPVNA